MKGKLKFAAAFIIIIGLLSLANKLTSRNDGYVMDFVYEYRDPYNSTCSSRATLRGLGQKVVSYSLYGYPNDDSFFKDVVEIAELLPMYYPNWTMRVHLRVPSGNESLNATLRDLEDNFEHLDLCDVNSLPIMGNITEMHDMAWRFVPMADPYVDVFVSRDLNTRFSEREVAAVEEWLESNVTFHIMRDHPNHTAKIMGGMWGAVTAYKRAQFAYIFFHIGQYAHKASSKKDTDQKYLAGVIWPVINGDSIQHDSYHCKDYEDYKYVRPWPVERDIFPPNFVGATPNSTYLDEACPLQCRPENHPHWVTC